MDITAAVAASTANHQTQASLLAIRLAAESQRQVVALLDQRAVTASNPAHLGNRIDTHA